MNSSPTISKLAVALVKAQSQMGNAIKDAVNPFFKKNYADINSVREATIPHLNANGISIIQPTTVVDGHTMVETVLIHESGEYISSLTPVIVDKPNDAQRHGSGLTYARRYALQSITNIGSSEDDDAQAAVGKPAPEAKPAPKPWKMTPEMNNHLQQLLDGSTLDLAGKATAGKAGMTAKSEAEWNKVINRLTELQTVPA